MGYKHRTREYQPGENVFEVNSTAGKADLGGREKLIPDDICASGVPPGTSQLHKQCIFFVVSS